MSYNQRLVDASNRIAALYGYRVENVPEAVDLTEFSLGDGIIVLNKNGEVINSGKIEDISYPGTDDFGYQISGKVKVNRSYYHTDSNYFRKL